MMSYIPEEGGRGGEVPVAGNYLFNPPVNSVDFIPIHSYNIQNEVISGTCEFSHENIF